MTTRDVALRQGDIRWLFPTLTDAAEQDAILHMLQTADDTICRVGQRIGVRPDAQIGDVPLNRFVYQRLGPEPEFPVTVLAAESWSDQICVSVLLAPTGNGPYPRPGPPWQVEATILVRCDSDPESCRWHEVDVRRVQPVGTPMEAAAEVLAASVWLPQRLQAETEESLRSRDQYRGHAPAPRRVD
jgi:hypothetical protein